MSSKLRSLAKRGLRSIGLQRITNPSLVDAILRHDVDTVSDVGANRGQFGDELREGGYRGRILSFEPMSSAFAELQRKASADPAWNAYNLGVGAHDGTLEISIRAKDVYSSFKANSALTDEKFSGAKEASREVVEVKRLDTLIARDPSLMTKKSYLKIDTQGFEQEVVGGAGNRLSSFAAVQMELALRPLYEGQLPFMDMVGMMEGLGFEIAMAKENGFDHDGCRLLELDVVFVRTEV
jgi:FkbM family methyltransferase